MPKELNEDTLAALAAQGGITDDTKAAEAAQAEAAAKAEADAAKGNLPDITLGQTGGEQGEGDALPGDSLADGATDKAGAEDSDLNKAVSKTLDGAGYTDEVLTARLTKDGGISDEFIEELKGKIDPDFVDAHVGRLRAEMQLAKVAESGRLDELQAKEKALKDMNDYIFNSVGGKDKFEVLSKTLKGEMTDEELAVINVKLASGNKTVVDEAMAFAVKKYNDIRGMGGKLMEGDAGTAQDAPEHMTKEEYRAVMRTEKYKTDPKYARQIDSERLKTREQDSIRYGAGQYYGYHPEKGRYSL